MLAIFATFFLACIVALALLMALALRLPIVDIVLLFLCATLTLEWYVQVRGIIFSVYDLVFGLAIPIFGYSFLRRGHFRNRYVFQVLALFAAYQIWAIVAQFAHPRNSTIPQLLWSSYKNYGIYLAFLLGGIVLATRPLRIQRWALAALVLSFALEALIGLGQTASGGWLFNSGINNRYLGFLTPIPDKLQGAALDLALLRGNDIDNGTFVGFIFRSIGTHRQANYFAVSMICGLGLCIAVIVNPLFSGLRRWARIGGVAMLAALGFSFTRTGYLALVAMGVWYFFSRMRSRTRWRIVVLVAACSFVVLALYTTGALQPMVASLPDNAVTVRLKNLLQPSNASEFSFRTELWRIALERVRAAPVFGLGDPIRLSEITDISPALDRDLPLHNELVRSLYYGGYVLGILYVLIHLWLFWISRKPSRFVVPNPIFTQWVVAANLCFVGLLVESIGIDWMPFISLQGFFWLMAGVAAMQYRPIFGAVPALRPQLAETPQSLVPTLALTPAAGDESQ
jgi:hypothetical protein